MTPASDPGAIDLAVLARLVGGNPDTVRRMALRFVQAGRDGLGELEAALAAGNVERIRELGHRVKSAALTVGAAGVADLCLRLERLPEAEPAAAQALIARLSALLEQVAGQIAQETATARGK
jgi:two-component system sensor histidine kinase/response regulator